jgi:hypothetical protein
VIHHDLLLSQSEIFFTSQIIKYLINLPHRYFSSSTIFIISQRSRRNTIHVSKLNSEARWGDIILFKCNASTPSHLLGSVSSWEWDHLGLVVLSQAEFPEGEGQELLDESMVSLDILEATAEGVTLYPLTGRVRAYNYNNVVSPAVSLIFVVCSLYGDSQTERIPKNSGNG